MSIQTDYFLCEYIHINIAQKSWVETFIFNIYPTLVQKFFLSPAFNQNINENLGGKSWYYMIKKLFCLQNYALVTNNIFRVIIQWDLYKKMHTDQHSVTEAWKLTPLFFIVR